MALEGAYAFDDIGSSTVVDLSGNGRDIDLTATNGQQVDGSAVLDNGALAKTGAGTISLPAALRVAIETDDRSLMFDGVGGRSVWWVRAESASLNTGVWGVLSLDAANNMVRARDQSNNGPTPSGPTIGALTATRHNFAVTYVRATGVVSYYYDGSLVGTSTFPAGTPLYVGADDLNIAEWGDLGPALDNLRFFSHALSDGEVAALAGTPVTADGVTVEGTASADLGGLTGAVSGTRVTNAVMTADVGGLVGTATATRTVTGTVVAGLGALIGTVSAERTTTGTLTSQLGTLVAVVTQAAELPATRTRVSGREPYRSVSGREPREAV